MATVLTPAPVAPPVTQGPHRKLWTRAEYQRLEETGLPGVERLELVEGELINKLGQNRPHSGSQGSIVAWLYQVFGWRFVMFDSPIDVAPEDNPTSEPEPDAVVLKRDISQFPSDNPRPDDLHLVVEVSDSSLGWDLSTKAGLYARAGIVEYWVLDVAARRLIVHRDPSEGIYKTILVCGQNDPIAPLAAPQAEFRPAEAFIV